MAKMINKIKERLATRLEQIFYDECRTEYEERKSLYYDVTKLPRDQIELMWGEARYAVVNRPKWRFIYRLSEVFNF